MKLSRVKPLAKYGAPKYETWRPEQIESFEFLDECTERFRGLCAPTGCGKSGIYAAIAASLPTMKRIAVVVSTKVLQRQVIRDFAGMGAVEIMGMGSYKCLLDQSGYTQCDQGVCRYGCDCELRLSGCDYFDALNNVKRSRFAVPNYSKWMADLKSMLRQNPSVSRGVHPLGGFDWLILDEAHGAPTHLAEFLQIQINPRIFTRGLKPPKSSKIEDFVKWARSVSPEVAQEVGGLKDALSFDATDRIAKTRAGKLAEVQRVLEDIVAIEGDWFLTRRGNGAIELDPISPKEYAEKFLFAGIKNVVFMSATLSPMVFSLLGVDEFDYCEIDSSFPKKNRPRSRERKMTAPRLTHPLH